MATKKEIEFEEWTEKLPPYALTWAKGSPAKLCIIYKKRNKEAKTW